MATEASGLVVHTRWRVFVLALLPCAVVVAVLAAALLNGVLAASLAIAKLPVQLKVDKLVGQELTLYPSSVDPVDGGRRPSARAGISSAKIDGLCLGLGADVPMLGDTAIKVTSPKQVSGDNLLLDAEELGGDLQAKDAVVGQDASRFSIGESAARGPVGTPGLQAGSVVLDNQVAVKVFALMAGSLKLQQVSVTLQRGTRTPC